jgi:peroxiredoxin
MLAKNGFETGEKVPDFILNDQNKVEFKLSDFKGKKILLSFHPLAWTSVCTDQMRSLEKNYNNFQELNTISVGISVDSVPSKNAWAKSINIKNTRLLSDFWPHGKVAKLFGLFREKEGFSERVNIIINEDQIIEFIHVYELSELPDINEIINILKTL